MPGRARSRARAAAAATVAVFGPARLYLGVDHPDDVLLGAAFAAAIAVTAFGYFTPDEVFPVAYRRGRTAHVDVTGRRGEAIRQAVADQPGLDVTEIKPVGLQSSAGSTPLRLRVQGGPEQFVFAKLYTKGHVRADRWYKLGRTIAYGTLEDESPFQTVRRLAEYEDYALYVLRETGVRTARSYGIVEITSEREYLLVTEFFKDAVEIGQAQVDDAIIDQGLAMIRKLWDAGLAHRDIKPGNLMVRCGKLLLIDVCFAQVRPSPWRQAVDLGNMMLVLALRSDPQRAYQRALVYFTEAELAEAFAATRGVASPAQLRAFIRRDPRDLLGDFRALAPPRPPIILQRWNSRRLALAAAVVAITVFAAYWTVRAFIPGPAGLGSDLAGRAAITVTLTAACDTAGARQVRSGQPGTQQFERQLSRAPRYSGLRYYTFPGGCVTYQFSFTPGASPTLAGAACSALSFEARSVIVDYVRRTESLVLCGRGAACAG